jgi:hypothetical protein
MESAERTPPRLEDVNGGADYWYYSVGCNVIPSHTRQKKTFVEWKKWQLESIPEEVHDAWKKEGKFNDGMAVIPGKVWRGEHIGEYLIFADLYNHKAITEFCAYFATGKGKSAALSHIAEKFIVEQHLDDNSKAHIFFFSEIMFPKKSSDINAPGEKANDDLPAIEIKGLGTHGIAYCTPSVHKNGQRYQILGTHIPVKLSEDQAEKLKEYIDVVCKRHGLHYLDYDDGSGNALVPIPDLFKDEYVIVANHNRHGALLRVIESLIKRLYGLYQAGEIRELAYKWNQKHCQPPLDDKEFEKQWRDGAKWILPKIKEEEQKEQEECKPILELTEELTKEVSWNDISTILDSSIKKDKAAKLITFCGMLLAQTNRDQLNIGFQAESSAGKSYIPMELANYFPQDEIMKVASASPTAFYHKGGKWDDARKALIVDLEHRIIIFMDMPGFQLMERLRPMASHDDRELVYMITENKKQGGLRTKTVILRGFPTIIFASAKQNMDEQEKTRLIQLSPAVDQEKLRESLELSTLRNADAAQYQRKLLENPKRIWLINRISSLRQCAIREIVIPDDGKAVFDRFIKEHENLKPRHQRDLPRIFAFIKAHCLLNAYKRDKLSYDTILANKTDVNAGFELYAEIERSTELGLSPYLFNIYLDVIKPLLDGDGLGLGISRDKIIRKFYQVRHKGLSPQVLKQEILPQLEAVGLI